MGRFMHFYDEEEFELGSAIEVNGTWYVVIGVCKHFDKYRITLEMLKKFHNLVKFSWNMTIS